jgi:hypothetical protein
MGKYTIWIDYGYEGWRPEHYDTKEDLEVALKNINSVVYGNSYLVTKTIEYKINVVDDEE